MISRLSVGSLSLQVEIFDAPAPAPTPARVSVPYQRASVTSREAAARVRPSAPNHERQVYEAILAAGARGKTRKELSHELPWAERQQNRITGRVSSLLQKGAIVETTARRDGSFVLVAAGGRLCDTSP